MADLSRYSRQTALQNFGICGQRKLCAAEIVVVGAGGVGSGALPILAGAGIGAITIIDSDTVSLSNLHRQTLYCEADIGKPKAECAAQKLRAINSQIKITPLNFKLEAGDESAREIFANARIILDATDSFCVRAAVSALSESLGLPQILAAAQGYEAQNFLFGKGFYFENIVEDFASAAQEPAARLPILAAAAHISGALAADEIIRAIASDFKSYETGKFVCMNMENSSFFKTMLA